MIAKHDWFSLITTHFDRQLAHGLSARSPCALRMWMASLDTRTAQYPADDARPAHLPPRHYRNIDAPKGCSLYWDLPALAAAHNMSTLTKNPAYSAAADAYVTDFLSCCVAPNGMFLWGNHYYWDAFSGVVKKFRGDETPQPIIPGEENGDFHETRPLPPAWDVLWRISQEKTIAEIETFTRLSFFDADGGFNRHADGLAGCAFLESGGIIAESLAWLYRKTGNRAYLETADRCIAYSFRNRNADTGLLINNPTGGTRWDAHIATTEIGLWAGCVVRAAAHVDADMRAKWINLARQAVAAYLKYGFDAATGQYYGKLSVANGMPVTGPLTTDFQPGDIADFWRPLFPAHDYPFQMAEACLALYAQTGDACFRTAVERWARMLVASLPARNGHGAYAEHYGRSILFLWHCARATGMNDCRETAWRVAEEAVAMLWDGEMFRTHPGEHRYDAVDGIGFLFLALIALHTDTEPDMYGMGL